MRAGRNDPCPCGSGAKYKRCCLAADETAERASTQRTFWDEDDFDDSDEMGDDSYDMDEVVLDVGDIRSVRYAYGFASSLKRAIEGRGLAFVAWTAPAIPRAILESFEREAVAELEGSWGDPRAGDPIQVEVIEIETDADIFEIEVFNRAILLLRTDDDEVKRIHRLCVVLENLSKQATAPAPANEDSDDEAPPPPTFTLDGLARRHSQQGGTCALCGTALRRTGAARHMAECAPAHDSQTGAIQEIVPLRVTAPNLPGYWLDLEARRDSRLEYLDRFLRNTWLECCGHLSRFQIEGVDYFSSGYEFGWSPPGLRQRVERPMSATLRQALPRAGEHFGYEYDFGSSTNLRLTVSESRKGRIGRSPVRLVARNTALMWPCAYCGAPATNVCAACRYEPNPFTCDEHARAHACGEEAYLPVVNSPRMGVCGYSGESY